MASSTRESTRAPATPHRVSSSSLRAGISSSSPHTPYNRLSSSNFTSHTSPGGSSLHQIDEPLVLEIGTRFLRAGFANESTPRCMIGVRPEHFGRVGLKGKGGTRGNLQTGEKGGPRFTKTGSEAWELWSHDLQDKDIGIIEDILERLLREAYNKYLLIDSKTKRLLISLPALIPIPLQRCLTQLLFTHFQPPSIIFLSSPVLVTVAAGLRSALVVDIGWHETVVTPVYELRPITTGIRCSNRASKSLIGRTGQLIWNAIKADRNEEDWWRYLQWEEVEDLIIRMCWCKSSNEAKIEKRRRARRVLGLPDTEDTSEPEFHDLDDDDDKKVKDHFPVTEQPDMTSNSTFQITLSTPSLSPPKSFLQLPFKSLSSPVEIAFFSASSTRTGTILDPDIMPVPKLGDLLNSDFGDIELEDDSDHTLSHLVFMSLLYSPIDIRAVCLPRIIITGGASNIPGLKSRIIGDVRDILVQRGGWSPVRPRRLYGNDRKHALITKELETPKVEMLETEKENLRIQHVKTGGVPPGTLRGVESLGAWAGGSIIAGARIKGLIEVEREKFLATVAAGGTGFT